MFKHGLIALLLSSFCCSAQLARISVYEFRWALWHPFAAVKVNKITKTCDLLVREKSIYIPLDNFTNGGKADAFRHCFYMGACAQKIKVKKLRKLGQAHEKGNYRQFLRWQKEEGELPDSLASVMDLQNNELGFRLGGANKKIELQELLALVISEINQGTALIMRRDKAGNYIDCNGKKIHIDPQIKTWNLPKCLVTSNSP